MGSYCFLGVTATFVAPGGTVNMGAGSGVADAGIDVAYNNPRNTMTVGADGEVMHSLHADKSGTITVRLLNTSDANAALQAIFNLEILDASAWGANAITVRNAGNQELVVARDVAFRQTPPRSYQKDGQSVEEWVFDCGKIDIVTGTY